MTSEPMGRERLGLDGCTARLSGVMAWVPREWRIVVTTEPVGRERLGGWTGFCQSVCQRAMCAHN